MKRALALVLLVGCGAGDPCDPFPTESCLSLEVRGPGLAIDQIALHARSGFLLGDGRSPPAPGGIHSLPVRVPIVPGGRFAGSFELEVRGLLREVIVGADLVHGTVAAGQHLAIIAELGGANASDLGGIDLASPPPGDLAAPPGSDLSTVRDLSRPSGSDLAGVGIFVAEPTNFSASSELKGVFGFSPQDVYACGGIGTVLHSTGDGKWTQQRTEPANTLEQISGAWGIAANDVYAFGTQATSTGTNPHPLLAHSTGNGTWLNQAFPGADSFSISINGFGGSAGTDLYAGVAAGTVTNAGAFHSAGDGNWFPQTSVSSPAIKGVNGLFVAAQNSIYLVDPRIWHSNSDGNWTLETITGVTNPEFTSVWASSSADVFAVGAQGAVGSQTALVMHSPGNGQWTQQNLPNLPSTTALMSIFGAAPDDVWAVGEGGAIVHYDGKMWTQLTSGVSGRLNGVWTGGGEVFAVTGSLVLHRR
jgi:hypothetical protein